MKIDIPEGIEILVVTGPESSGKTTCVKRIKKNYQWPLVAEYAREYLTIHGPKYTFQDIKIIANQQLSNEHKTYQEHPLIICDTDLMTLEIWALERYGKSLGLKDDLIHKKHYLLCYPDIPWQPDPLRENPNDRLRLFNRYQKYLDDLNVSYSILKEKDRKELSFEAMK